ncbi:MAG: glycosyltransferase family 4 protein [Candidatus Parvarchaeota archaeon]|nr:glycosyltransferase family 4 protein [Candidatus Jingweiarchaeum tengchongense]MCW1298256.1 glycosyltransferase family 4 protein [Candidatus Jingweiarchaeum tengchongense]MCW1300053.1 glycosyltransferase family 4 protein [Candidatus Jingweiarchaeum tengchongense]MCW1304808.1 glycosyltransferase family 4 protein [Candidatus Jingweiarchaeum tengchongense]MCW1305398.1 glycosyltransferase family 4 protein [Candidatus Jingweiarchaeum tengchongense]
MKIAHIGWEIHPDKKAGGLYEVIYNLSLSQSKLFNDYSVSVIGPYGGEKRVISEQVTPNLQYVYINSFQPRENVWGLEGKLYQLTGIRSDAIDNLEKEKRAPDWVKMYREVITFGKFSSDYVKNMDPDILHVHDWLDAIILPFSRESGLKSKKLFHVHSTEKGRTDGYPDPTIFEIEKNACHEADAVITVSKNMVDEIQHLFGIERSKINVAYNGIDPQKFNPEVNAKLRPYWRDFILELAGWKEPVKLVGFISRLEFADIKGFKTLIEAASKVHNSCPNTKFVFVCGPKKQTKSNESLVDIETLRKNGHVFKIDNGLQQDRFNKIKEVGLGGNVLWFNCMLDKNSLEAILNKYNYCGEIPSKEDPKRGIYAACDLFAFPSTYEPFGIVASEAMGMGKPVVGCEGTGIHEQIKYGGGIACKPRDSNSLANCLIDVLTDDVLYEQLSENASKSVKKKFTWDAVARDVDRIYQKVLSKK